jgi:hypothetical protein
VIRPDLKKLILRTSTCARWMHKASDSGRIVGPKAANLGELKQHYPEAVNPGLVIPFGEFRSLLNQPIKAGGLPVFDWLRAEYTRLRAIADPAQQQAGTREFLERLREWITSTDPGESFRSACAVPCNRPLVTLNRSVCSCAATPMSRTCPGSPVPA